MKKLSAPLIFFLLISTCVSAQKIIKTEEVTSYSTYVFGKDFKGIIFDKGYYQNPKDTTETRMKKFTPSDEDIISAESLLRRRNNYRKKNGDIRYIFTHLKEYNRQYIGYYNAKGEKLIYVNCFPVDQDWANAKIKGAKSNIPTWYVKLFHVFDGGKSFWQATINLNSKSIVNISINGVA